MKSKRPGRRARLKEVAAYFLRMGFLGFGGPLALVAMYQDELVEKRKWLAAEDYARALALIKALPGPISTQMAVHLGRVRAGTLGGLVAGFCLVLPAFLMMLFLGAFYSSVEALAWTRPLLFGMQAAALGVIADSLRRLGRPYFHLPAYWAVAAAAIAITTWKPASEPVVIIGAGLLGLLSAQRVFRRRSLYSFSPVIVVLFLIMLKSGALVFGTGLAIVPLLIHDVVTVNHWLSHRQFMDALAFGQVTPGPVVITATFIGYKVAGFTGALVATIGIFAPSFFNILTWFPWAERKLSGSPAMVKFVQWAVAAVSGAIAVTIVRLGASPLEGGTTPLLVVIAAAAAGVAWKTKIPVWAVIPAGGLVSALVAIF